MYDLPSRHNACARSSSMMGIDVAQEEDYTKERRCEDFLLGLHTSHPADLCCQARVFVDSIPIPRYDISCTSHPTSHLVRAAQHCQRTTIRDSPIIENSRPWRHILEIYISGVCNSSWVVSEAPRAYSRSALDTDDIHRLPSDSSYAHSTTMAWFNSHPPRQSNSLSSTTRPLTQAASNCSLST